MYSGHDCFPSHVFFMTGVLVRVFIRREIVSPVSTLVRGFYVVEFLVAGLRDVGQADCCDGDAHHNGAGSGCRAFSAVAGFLTAIRPSGILWRRRLSPKPAFVPAGWAGWNDLMFSKAIMVTGCEHGG
jgi:hypothetical protein